MRGTLRTCEIRVEVEQVNAVRVSHFFNVWIVLKDIKDQLMFKKFNVYSLTRWRYIARIQKELAGHRTSCRTSFIKWALSLSEITTAPWAWLMGHWNGISSSGLTESMRN